MRVVYSVKYKPQAKSVIDEVIRIFGSAENYKKEVWGREITKEEVVKICDRYLEKN